MSTTTLPPETWGERFARARKHAGLEVREASEIVSQVWPTSESTLRRFEGRSASPERARDRALAVLALLAYGINPDDFELTLDDVPRGIDRNQLFDLGKRGNSWLREWAARRAS